MRFLPSSMTLYDLDADALLRFFQTVASRVEATVEEPTPVTEDSRAEEAAVRCSLVPSRAFFSGHLADALPSPDGGQQSYGSGAPYGGQQSGGYVSPQLSPPRS